MESLGFLERAKGFLLQPTETFKKAEEENFGECFRYFLILSIFYAALNAIIITATVGTIWGSLYSAYGIFFNFVGTPVFMLLLFIIFLISGLIGIFIIGAVIHLGVLMFGGKRGYIETVKAMVYAETPAYIFGWIPFVVLFMWIWTLILMIFGLKNLQKLSTGKAIAAIVIPILIFGVIFTVIIAVAVFFYVTSMI